MGPKNSKSYKRSSYNRHSIALSSPNKTSKALYTTNSASFRAQNNFYHYSENPIIDLTPPMRYPKSESTYTQNHRYVWDGRASEEPSARKLQSSGTGYMNIDRNDYSEVETIREIKPSPKPKLENDRSKGNFHT
ncbi:unnamed protein product [Rotaria socialis]|uniref:Uncharacterized protein n=1 Tax=Rotaria socialis TaxID=392032 RepID=A0A818TYG2_9BILA|nr:unnamed protein product [Rotaria socialis]CAF3747613.1 unnamed protein product [Rotaria socialis]